MHFRSLAIVLLLVAALQLVAAKKFTRCELVKALEKQGVPKDQLRNWICLAESESGLRSDAVGGPNKNGSYDYGIFQINSRYWCGRTAKGGDCHVKCSDLTNNDISDDVTCARKIYKRQGFSAWYGWISKCKGRTLPPLPKC